MTPGPHDPVITFTDLSPLENELVVFALIYHVHTHLGFKMQFTSQ